MRACRRAPWRSGPALVVSVLLALPVLAGPWGPAASAPSGAAPAATADAARPSLRIFPTTTTPGHEISLSGTVTPAIARPYALQRLVGGSWRRVAGGVSDSGGAYAKVWQAPHGAGPKSYRVVLRHHRIGTVRLPRRVSDVVRLTVDAGAVADRWLPAGLLGTPYSVSLAASTDPPGTWTLGDGSPPDGVSLGSDGSLAGTPEGDPGTHSFTAVFTDEYGVSVASPLLLRVGRGLGFRPRDPGFADLLAYDDFRNHPDGPLVGTVTDSGHTYDAYHGTYDPYAIGGAYRIDPAADTWNGWSFVTLREEQVPTSVGAMFFFDAPARYGAQEVVLAVWGADSTVAKGSVQFIATAGGWGMAKVVDGYRIYAARGSYTTFPRQDGTNYEMSMHLDRSTDTVTVNLPDGTVRSWTDPDFTALWGSTFAVQIRRTSTSGDAGVTAIFSGL